MSEKREWNGGRFIKSGHWKWVVPLVIVIIGLVAVGFATRGTSSNSRADGLCNDKFTQMEHRGTIETILKEHQNMMEQLRASSPPLTNRSNDSRCSAATSRTSNVQPRSSTAWPRGSPDSRTTPPPAPVDHESRPARAGAAFSIDNRRPTNRDR